jgi:hypothetical protein
MKDETRLSKCGLRSAQVDFGLTLVQSGINIWITARQREHTIL